jgi:hypothetical protein
VAGTHAGAGVGYFTDAPPNIFGSSLIAVWVNRQM